MENVDTLDLETSEEKIDLAAAKKLINLEQLEILDMKSNQ